jgi:hypothetical protein
MVGVNFVDLNDADREYVVATLARIVIEEAPALDQKLQKEMSKVLSEQIIKHSAQALKGPADERVQEILGQKTWKALRSELTSFNALVADGKIVSKEDLALAVSPEALGALVHSYMLGMKVTEEDEVTALAEGLGDVIREAMSSEMTDVKEVARAAAQEAMADQAATTPWGQVARDFRRFLGRAPGDPVRSVIEALAAGALYLLVASRVSFLSSSRTVVVTVGVGTVALVEGTILFFRRRGKRADPPKG